jgi:hypothetical protein
MAARTSQGENLSGRRHPIDSQQKSLFMMSAMMAEKAGAASNLLCFDSTGAFPSPLTFSRPVYTDSIQSCQEQMQSGNADQKLTDITVPRNLSGKSLERHS